MKALILAAGFGSRLAPLTDTIPKSLVPVNGKPILFKQIENLYENGITDISRVGLYGLTYKENVDDIRESPTMQMLECMQKHLAYGVKVYDPYVTKDLVDNQYQDFDAFLNDVEIVVIMVGHDQIKAADDKLKGKIILDTRNVCKLDGVYKL